MIRTEKLFNEGEFINYFHEINLWNHKTMDVESIISDITSGDVGRIRIGTYEIISVSQEKEKILLFERFRQLIADSTANVPMGGAFAPNKRFVDYALKIIDFHCSSTRCPCCLYSDFGYYDTDPRQEEEKQNITIKGIKKIENIWIDYYFCTCSRCGEKFKAFERDAHYTSWEWKRTTEAPIGLEDPTIKVPVSPQIEVTQAVTPGRGLPIEVQKQGYYELINLCLGESKKREVIEWIDQLKDYNGNDNFYSTLNYVKDHLDSKGIHFIMVMDLRQEIRDLTWRVSSSLIDNFNVQIELPDFNSYGQKASVTSEYVMYDFDTAIRTKGFQIGFVDTESDEIVLVIHQITDQNAVAESIKKIGYNYASISPATKRFETKL